MERTELINKILLKGFDLFYMNFNHILTVFFSASITMIKNIRNYILHKT